ncbi:glycosyltransferase (plasmid) [Paroceanicella profunda]|uniref:Glycosyltransferase n=1 Tax=Paroceanicella profunda TaxID=2579971 RepID=A0A5B8G298_9RHOB|nr:glycosyltransferase [Paroceanicella profunda]QDL94735.1 glycosyltransferase [Paroceanicella profunda]
MTSHSPAPPAPAPGPLPAQGPEAGGLTIAIGIATAGRREVLAETIAFLARQTRPADRLLICPADPEADLDRAGLEAAQPGSAVVRAPRGLCNQRNALIRAAGEADLLVFLDDDFLPCPDFLAEAERLFRAAPEVVMATGTVLADGILGPGLTFAEGLAALEAAGPAPGDAPVEVYNGYGCNMVVRLAPVRGQGLAFDEDLPFYAWLEDVDFSRRLAAHGRIVKSPRLRGVHLGSKRGRSPGRRLGYSQIANPVHLLRKGTLSRGRALRQMRRNLLANAARAAWPEPWVDRRGRLAGNLLALAHALTGRLSPGRVRDMS